ncbi:hypothetical protein FB451DRAFT_1404052 [Mycena latifolia]|nr:hypothetical protein FB451DRAFT_1404052 [Mycena latifolia]
MDNSQWKKTDEAGNPLNPFHLLRSAALRFSEPNLGSSSGFGKYGHEPDLNWTAATLGAAGQLRRAAQGRHARGEQRRINKRSGRLDWQPRAWGISNATSRCHPRRRAPRSIRVFRRRCETSPARASASVQTRKWTHSVRARHALPRLPQRSA